MAVPQLHHPVPSCSQHVAAIGGYASPVHPGSMPLQRMPAAAIAHIPHHASSIGSHREGCGAIRGHSHAVHFASMALIWELRGGLEVPHPSCAVFCSCDGKPAQHNSTCWQHPISSTPGSSNTSSLWGYQYVMQAM